MKRKFNPTSVPTRCAFAAAALLTTVLIVESIDGLSGRYVEQAHVTVSQPVVVAHR